MVRSWSSRTIVWCATTSSPSCEASDTARLSADNAGEALAIVDSGESIDLLFTDLVMPGPINGRRLAIEARKRRPSLKVLYTSGYAETALIHDGRLDADAMLLAKPYRKIELAKMIRAALAPDPIQHRD